MVIPNGIQLGGCNRAFEVSNTLSLSLSRILLNQSYYGCIVVGLGEVNSFFTFRGDGHTSDSSINFTGYNCRGQAIPFNFVYFQSCTHGVSQFFSNHYVVAISVLVGSSDFNCATFSRGLGPVVGSICAFHTNLQDLLRCFSLFFTAATAASHNCHCCNHHAAQS